MKNKIAFKEQFIKHHKKIFSILIILWFAIFGLLYSYDKPLQDVFVCSTPLYLYLFVYLKKVWIDKEILRSDGIDDEKKIFDDLHFKKTCLKHAGVVSLFLFLFLSFIFLEFFIGLFVSVLLFILIKLYIDKLVIDSEESGFIVYRKLLTSLIVITIGIMSYTSVIDQIVFLDKLDKKGNSYVEKTLKRASYSYLLLRSLNAGISVVQTMETEVKLFGFGGSFSPGEILDPVNDVVERASWLMLLAIVSLGIQKILLEIGIWFGFKLLLSISMLMILTWIWTSQFLRINLHLLAYKLIFVAIIFRYFIPTIAIVNDQVYKHFLESKYTNASIILKNTTDELDKLDSNDSSLWNNLKEKYNIAKDILDKMKDKLINFFGNIVDIMIVFVIQTLIIPIFVLWVLNKLFVFFVGHDSINLEQKLKDIVTTISQALDVRRYTKKQYEVK